VSSSASAQVPGRYRVRDSGRLSLRSYRAAPASLGSLAGDAEPGADFGPGVAEGAQAFDGLGDGSVDLGGEAEQGIRASLSSAGCGLHRMCPRLTGGM
jgi:hypothetical protein